MKKTLLIILLLWPLISVAQIDLDYKTPDEYRIEGIKVSGENYFGTGVIVAFSGLSVGETITIPGNDISDAIRNIWKQKYFSDVRIIVDSTAGNKIWLRIDVQTRVRLARFSLQGVKKGQAKKIREELGIKSGDIVTPQLLETIKQRIDKYFVGKGYPNAEITIEQFQDSLFNNNSIRLDIIINKGERVKIDEISFAGNEELNDKPLKRQMKGTKEAQWFNFFRSSKFIPEKYEEDKMRLIEYYNNQGFRDAEIVSDSVYYINEKRLKIDIALNEGNKYHFRHITFTGNTKYTTRFLEQILNIKNGDPYDPVLLQQRLSFNPNGIDVASLYLDNGYLFSRIIPVEVGVQNDSIDIEIRIYEGPQAVIENVYVEGNTKTHDHVILREIRTKPGDKFNRSDVIRSQRELGNLGFFDPEQMDVSPIPNPEKGTVDLVYKVTERSTDQLELQGGYGQQRLVGSFGVAFNNFSLKNLTNLDSWDPVPSGDGQKLSMRVYTNGKFFQSYTFSFTEPWLGGKKPNSLSFNLSHSRINNSGLPRNDPNHSSISITGGTVGFGQRLTWPDNYFSIQNLVTYQRYSLRNYREIAGFTNGIANNFNFNHILTRNSVDHPIFPRSGSELTFSFQWTPPYSLIRGEFSEDPSEKYKLLEYHKTKASVAWYHPFFNKFVFGARAQAGFLGLYNRDYGLSPFERFYMGGSGLGGFFLDSREIIAMRGYPDNSLTPDLTRGAAMFNKYTFDIRYPLSLNPSATIFALGFFEAGNSFMQFKDYSPYDLKRAAGAGVRIFLPMFGLFGLDYGWRLDDAGGNQRGKGEFTFSIGQSL